MENKNYCQVGTPVQFMKAFFVKTNPKGKEWVWAKLPAIIQSVNGSVVDIIVFPKIGDKFEIKRNVRHEDFKKDGEDFWNYIPEKHP